MARQTAEQKSAKALDKKIEASYYQQAQGREILVLDILRLYADVRKAVAAGGDLDAAVKVAVEKYSKPSAVPVAA